MQLVLIQSSEVLGVFLGCFWGGGGGEGAGGRDGGVHLCIPQAEYDPCPNASHARNGEIAAETSTNREYREKMLKKRGISIKNKN